MTFKANFSLLVICIIETCYYDNTVCIADIKSGLKVLIYNFNSREAIVV